jgi:hypothetical protein
MWHGQVGFGIVNAPRSFIQADAELAEAPVSAVFAFIAENKLRDARAFGRVSFQNNSVDELTNARADSNFLKKSRL